MGKQIAIVGAGVSGLMACKYAKEKGFDPIIFEARSHLGGIWAKTIKSTKLQTPREYHQFTDFPWPKSVTDEFPDHNQVKDYFESYAHHFNIIPHIKFDSKVVQIDYVSPFDDDQLDSWSVWGGSGEAFSPNGSWNFFVLDTKCPSSDIKIYSVDFVILCLGNYSDFPNIPKFPVNKGPEVFIGKVQHSMDYAAMENDEAAEFIKGKCVTVIGFAKSALDIATAVSTQNGVKYPCTLLFRRAHWIVPQFAVKRKFNSINRFSQLMHHKPNEGVFAWLLAVLLSPFAWISRVMLETYLKLRYPLHKYNIVPDWSFLKDMSSCAASVMPTLFYARVKEGSLILKKSESFCFCEKGLLVDDETQVISTDIVIFATGYRPDEKLKNVLKSTYFLKQIAKSSAPFYRECIHPRIPQLAILGYSENVANLHMTEMKARWLSYFFAGKFKLPAINQMEHEMTAWKTNVGRSAKEGYKRTCVTPSLIIHMNDLLCKDMGVNPGRKSWFLPELFAPYVPSDYANI